MNLFLTFTTLGLSAALSHAQSFPIVPVSEPTYPFADPDFAGFDYYPWRDDPSTLQRTGDINNDGLDDLIVIISPANDLHVLNESRHIWIYPRNEAGTFDQPYPIEAVLSPDTYIYWITDFMIYDHDHNGLNDIVIPTEHGAQVLLATPQGFTQAASLYSEQYFDSPRVLYTDTDRDGDIDIVVWSYSNLNFNIWLNQGIAGYISINVMKDGINTDSANDLRFSDFDGDGDLDVLLTNGEELYWREKTSLGYAEAVLWTIDATNFYTSQLFAFADVNADGNTDVVSGGSIPNGQDGVGFYLAPFTNGESREIPYFEFPDFENTRSNHFTRLDEWNKTIYSPGDLDGDGTDDLILKPYPNSDIAWRITDPMNLNGRFGISNEIDIHGEGFIESEDYPSPDFNTADAYLDINNDGALDRIVPASARLQGPLSDDYNTSEPENQGLMLWANLGNPFTPDTVFNEQDTIRATQNVHFTHADLDYDGEDEIVLTTQDRIRTVRRNPDDLWAYDRPPGNTSFSDPIAGFRTIVTQLDSDDRLELVSLRLQNPYPMPAIFVNVEVPAYGEFYIPDSLSDSVRFDLILQDLDIGFQPDSSSFAVGDIDADGDNDIIIRGDVSTIDGPDGQSVLTWINDGDANFTLGPISLIGYPMNGPVHTIELIDHDHDGDFDLVSCEKDSSVDPAINVIKLYENDGQGNFTPAITIPIEMTVQFQYWIEVNDLDLDGYDDIQVLIKNTSQNQSEVVVLYGSAAGISTEPVYFAGSGGAEVHCADLDGNGLPDLYTCSYESTRRQKNSITIMFQTAPREFMPAISINDIEMSAVDALDMNRDGVLDLIGGGTDTNDLRVIYSVPKPCPADLTLDGVLDFFDITLFIHMFLEERPLADLNHDGILDFFDFSVLIETFRDGCP